MTTTQPRMNASTKTPLHLRLTNEQWIQETKGLTGAEIRVLYYIKTLDPFGDRKLDLQVTGIAKALECAKGTVSKALKKLDALELIELSFERVGVKITASGNSFLQENEFPTGNQPNLQETSQTYRKPLELVGNADIDIDRARDLKTLKTNSDLNTQERACENSEIEEKASSTEPLIETPKLELATKEAQIVSIGQSSAPATSLITKKSSTPDPYFGARRINPLKGCDKSCVLDPWMETERNPNRHFVQWLFHKRASDQKNVDERRRTFTASESNACQEIRNDAARAADLWKEFLQEMHHRVQVFNSRVQAGILVSDQERQEIAVIAPYAGLEPLPTLVLAAAFDIQKQISSSNEIAVNATTVQPPEEAINPSAYKEFVAEPLPSEEESLKGRAFFVEQLRQRMSAPKAKFIDTPKTAIAKYKAWLKSEELPLRTEAKNWAKRNELNLEIEYDDYGNIIDFEELQF